MNRIEIIGNRREPHIYLITVVEMRHKCTMALCRNIVELMNRIEIIGNRCEPHIYLITVVEMRHKCTMALFRGIV